MGTDIHLFVEKRKPGGRWQSADTWTPDEYSDKKKPPLRVAYDDRFYRSRNYDLFAILANVRNGRGFAGCITGQGFNPIDLPRGLPADVTSQVKRESDQWGSDGHSHSHFTVAEILSFDWTQKTGLQGWLNAVQAEDWLRVRSFKPFPEEYCGDVTGWSVVKISMAEMETAINRILCRFSEDGRPRGEQWKRAIEALEREMPHTYALAEWQATYAECCKQFWTVTIPRLLTVGKPEDVRIVFWFDN